MRWSWFALALAVLTAWTLTASAPTVLARDDASEAPRCDASPLAERACAGLEAARAGRWTEAEAALESALLTADDAVRAMAPRIEAALAEARAELGSIDARCSVAGATVALDGTDRGLAPLERPLRATAGAHVVSCRARDHEDAQADVTVTAGALVSVELTPARIDRRPVLERESDGQRIVGYTFLGLGAASVAVGFGALGAGLDAPAGTGSDRELWLDVARATLIGGGVALVAGIVLTLTAP